MLSDPCGPNGVQQTYNTDAETFALYAKTSTALDEMPTDCLSMITGNTKHLRVLEFTPEAFLTPVLGNDSETRFTKFYVCSDTSWGATTWFSRYTAGPAQTWMVFTNSCPTRAAQVQVTINRTGTHAPLCMHSSLSSHCTCREEC